jgi:cell division protein FtsB
MRELWSNTGAQWVGGALAGLTLLFLALNLNGALGQLTRLQTKEQGLRQETTRLTREISTLKKEIQRIKTDPSVYAEVARNDYLYLKPGEKLTVVLKQDGRTAGKPDGWKAGRPEGKTLGRSESPEIP